MQACIYRFHRNERNVFKAECIINKKSILTDSYTNQIFTDLFADAEEEYDDINSAGPSKAVLKRTVQMAKSSVENLLKKRTEFLEIGIQKA